MHPHRAAVVKSQRAQSDEHAAKALLCNRYWPRRFTKTQGTMKMKLRFPSK
jgi:hypothetical protein